MSLIVKKKKLELEDQIKKIHAKLQQLLLKHDELKKENDRLNKELARATTHNSQYQQTIDSLKQQVEILKLTSGEWDEKDKKELEKRINLYIKEIDKCIALLNE